MPEFDSKGNFTFITFNHIGYSRSGVYLDRNPNDFPLQIIQLTPKFSRYFTELWRQRKSLRDTNQVLVVLSPCSVLVPLLKFLTRNPIVLDAGWPLTDAEITKRNTFISGYRYLQAWLIDFLAFHSAKITILESNAQKIHVSHKYLIPKSKLRVLFTGVNEKKFKQQHNEPENRMLLKYKNILKGDFVLFRGKNNSESGIENIVKLADNVTDSYNFVILTNKIPNDLKARENILFITEYITDFEISLLYRKCFLSLGQLSNSKRLDRTIPHKAFESGYFGTPYLTLKRNGIMEFLSGKTEAIFVDSLNLTNISKIIEELHSDLNWQNELKMNIKNRYSNIASQAELKLKFFRILNTLN